MQFKSSVPIYSPRWGHDDTYDISLAPAEMTIVHGARVVSCVWGTNGPTWQGNLMAQLRNDGIYAPDVLPEMLVHLWGEWRSRAINNTETEAELVEVAKWLNTVSHSKPKTDFWRQFF